MEYNKEVEEKVEVTINEVAEDEVEVKDVSFSLNTMSSGRAGYITPLINGELEGIFVSALDQVEISITLESSDINVFQIQSFQGTQFIPVRLGVVDMWGQSFKDGHCKWFLNDKLKIEIKGPMNAEVEFIVRYC